MTLVYRFTDIVYLFFFYFAYVFSYYQSTKTFSRKLLSLSVNPEKRTDPVWIPVRVLKNLGFLPYLKDFDW